MVSIKQLEMGQRMLEGLLITLAAETKPTNWW
jgi:hypothetical protein